MPMYEHRVCLRASTNIAEVQGEGIATLASPESPYWDAASIQPAEQKNATL